jgi:hypothetical protein
MNTHYPYNLAACTICNILVVEKFVVVFGVRIESYDLIVNLK